MTRQVGRARSLYPMKVPFSIVGALLVSLSASAFAETQKPSFIINYELVEMGFKVFDRARPESERREALKAYVAHPLMKLAFERYSSPRRPPEHRVSSEVFETFVSQLWSAQCI
jgi:hypothetical protein